MGSPFSLVSVGSQALFAAYSQLQTAGSNIANANTVGYSRQSVQLATAESQYSDSGYLGRGVTVTTVSRAANMFLTQQLVAVTATSAADKARSDMLGQLEKVFVGGKSGLGQAATQIFNAFADLAAVPSDPAARTAVLGRLEDFASLARSSSDQIEALQGNLTHDVKGAVDQVNTLATALASLNITIRKAANQGQNPNDLYDQRDLLVKRIAEQVQVQSYVGADQTASVFVGIGQTLVLGGVVHRLTAVPDPKDPAHIGIAIEVSGISSLLSEEQIGDGQMGGLMHFQNRDLTEARNRIGQLVAGVAGAINRQQTLGLDLSGGPGAALLRFTGPVAVPANTNAHDAAGYPLASVNLSVADPSQLKASDYELVVDPAQAGQYRISRLSDGVVFNGVADGQTVDGLTIQIGPVAPSAGESFRLKPLASAATDVTVMLKNPRGLAAANPVTGQMGAANTGTAAIRSLNAVAAPAAPYAPLTVAFTDDAGSYQVLDASQALVAAGTWTAGQPIAHDGLEINLTGVPKTGDSLSISPTVYPAASNGNALRFDNLASLNLIDGQTVGDAYASAMSAVGVQVQGARVAAETSGAVTNRAAAELTSVVGVNIDEEAAKLMQFQQAYQASAKILQTAQAMFDALLSIAR